MAFKAAVQLLILVLTFLPLLRHHHPANFYLYLAKLGEGSQCNSMLSFFIYFECVK